MQHVGANEKVGALDQTLVDQCIWFVPLKGRNSRRSVPIRVRSCIMLLP